MGSLSLKKKISTSLATRYNSTYYIRFKGPAGITFGNFFNAGIAAVINSGGAYNFYFDENLNNPTTYYTDGGDWYDSNGITITTNNIIPINTIVQIYNDFADYTINFGGNIENYFSGQTSIKKQNLSILKSSNYYPIEQSVYIFKSAVNNTLGNIFNYAQFEPYTDAISIYTQGNLDGVYNSFYTDGSSFIYDDYITNANNYVIPANSLLIFTTSYDISITVGGGAIIQKYYSGKISLYKKFAPNTLQGLSLWLKADAGVTLAGSNVTAWADQSGNSRNFTKSIANTGFPTFSSGAVLFTRIDKYYDPNASILALPSSSLNLTGPYTLIAVFRGIESTVFSKSNNDDKRRKYQIATNSSIVYTFESINSEDNSIGYDTEVTDPNTKRLVIAQYLSDTSGVLYYNGTQVATGDGNGPDGAFGYGLGETNNASIFIGAAAFSEGTGYNAEASDNMYVYEIIFYNRALSTDEIQKIENYLNQKYSIY